ncbi:MAG: hypothetical protein ACYTEL_26790, partial [Planctomycetota bacterium]
DLIAECRKCNVRTRVDHLKAAEGATEQAEQHTEHVSIDSALAAGHDLTDKICPNCSTVGQFTEPMPFKLMFETQMGPNVDDSMTLYMRPETAQGIFANFRNVLDTTRVKNTVRHRPDRKELQKRGDHQGLYLPDPRAVKRRPKEYASLNRPRDEMRRALLRA